MTELTCGSSVANAPVGWWDAVQAAAVLIVNDGCHYGDDSQLRRLLIHQGFTADDISKALDWLDKVAVSGQMMDVLGMLCPRPEGARVDNPLERVFVSDAVWRDLESSRRRGLLSGDTTEMILEGIRAMDTRDWEDEEVRAFIKDVLTANGQEADGERLELGRRRRLSDFYS